MSMRMIDDLIKKKEWLIQLRIIADIEERIAELQKEIDLIERASKNPKKQLLIQRQIARVDELNRLNEKIENRLKDQGCYDWIGRIEQDKKQSKKDSPVSTKVDSA